MSTGSRWNSTSRTERVLRLNAEIREQRDAIAALRAEWAKLDAPLRLQGLAERHLQLKPLSATQYDSLKNLPERPPSFVQARRARSDRRDDQHHRGCGRPASVTGSVPRQSGSAPGDQQ